MVASLLAWSCWSVLVWVNGWVVVGLVSCLVLLDGYCAGEWGGSGWLVACLVLMVIALVFLVDSCVGK